MTLKERESNEESTWPADDSKLIWVARVVEKSGGAECSANAQELAFIRTSCGKVRRPPKQDQY